MPKRTRADASNDLKDPQTTRLRVAVCGYGRAGTIHVRNVQAQHDRFTLAYVVEPCDLPSDIELGRARHVRRLTDEVWQGIDALIVATPTPTHEQLVCDALRRNKHVFVEKPLVHGSSPTRTCFALAREHQRVLFVGYNRRFDPTLQAVARQLHRGDIGQVHTALTISRDYPYPTAAFLRTAGGLFHDCATHDIDYINWMLRDRPVTCAVHVPTNAATTDYNIDHAVVLLHYSKGAMVTLHLSRIASSYDQRCEFFGEHGEVRSSQFEPDGKLSFPERYAHAFANELHAFYDCVVNGAPVPVTESDCLTNYAVAEACARAVDTKQTVHVVYGNGYRDFDDVAPAVKTLYETARTKQTLAFVQRMHRTFAKCRTPMPFWEILDDLNTLVDVSDPDCAHPNMLHALQTAERMRSDGQPKWMQLIGLMHDMGKIMYKRGCDADGTSRDTQWAMVGDTFVVGCKLPDVLVYPECNDLHPDRHHPVYSTELGMYTKGCGLDNVHCSWGHDEYLYRVLTSPENPHSLPDVATYIVRFHSLYAYHKDGAYRCFQSDRDRKYLPLLQKFNAYDLYTKTDTQYDATQLKPYYMKLFAEFFQNDVLYV